ncbi:hypothetical protein [Teichococcus rhizosphaerae]|uniref:hypothetical protein n=1 Tax=Teichococcus rhizosphaerae TaxID=1335062 RepID=UPI00159BE559|nr:hypothetical protein [Pseudoroseomonas rhizosphaerae]
MRNGLQVRGAFGGEHDIINVYVDLEELPEDSEDGQELIRLGFHPGEEAGNWGYHT